MRTEAKGTAVVQEFEIDFTARGGRQSLLALRLRVGVGCGKLAQHLQVLHRQQLAVSHR